MTVADLATSLDRTLATLRPIATGDDYDDAIAARWRIIRSVAVANLRGAGDEVDLIDDLNRFTGEPYAGITTSRGERTIFSVDLMDGGPWMWAIVDAGYRNIAFGVLGEAVDPTTADQIVTQATDLLAQYVSGAAVADLPAVEITQPDVAEAL